MAKKLKMKYKTKKNLKKVLIGVACVGGVALLASGTKALMDYNESDVKTIHPTFAIGGLDSNGKYEESETTLYTIAVYTSSVQIKNTRGVLFAALAADLTGIIVSLLICS